MGFSLKFMVGSSFSWSLKALMVKELLEDGQRQQFVPSAASKKFAFFQEPEYKCSPHTHTLTEMTMRCWEGVKVFSLSLNPAVNLWGLS